MASVKMSPHLCNKCYRQEKPEMKFFIWSCGHVACERCKNPTNCPVCRISSKPSDVAQIAIFNDPLTIYNRYAKMFEIQCKQDAIKFDYYINKMPEQLKKINDKIPEYYRIAKQTKLLKQKEKERGEKMRRYIAYYEKDINRGSGPSISKTSDDSSTLRPKTPVLSSTVNESRVSFANVTTSSLLTDTKDGRQSGSNPVPKEKRRSGFKL